jgi:WD40 repeat protein
MEHTINPKSIFFSYGHDPNRIIVERLKVDLENRGHKVWIDIDRIGTWDDWRGTITQGLHDSDMAIAFISIHSVRKPGVCLNEISMALQHFGKVYPIVVEAVPQVDIPVLLTAFQWPDLSDWKSKEKENPLEFEKFYQRCLTEIVNKIEGECSQLANEIELLKRILDPVTFDSKFLQHLGGFVGRDWVFKEFDQWLSQKDSRLFWLKAGPGFGKSAISVQLVKQRPDLFAANWFCDHQSSVLSDPIRALSTIAFQLALNISGYRSKLLALMGWDKNTDHSIAPEIAQKLSRLSLPELFRYLLSEPLSTVIPQDHKHLILIDALDESDSSNGNNPLASLIALRLTHLPNWINFVVTSRPDESVTRQLQKFNPQNIDSNDIRNQTDLEEYASQHIITLPIFSNWDEDKKKSYINEILAKSDGMILYLKLIQEDLKKDNQPLDQIKTLPSGLDGFYDQMFLRIFPDMDYYRENIAKLLGLMICALEPMTDEELEEALDIDDDILAKWFRDLSQILVKVPREGEPKLTCRTFCHKSFYDWLVKTDNAYCISKKSANKRIAKYCKDSLLRRIKGVNSYIRRHSVEHFVYLEHWEDALNLICDLHFIEERLIHSELKGVFNDFALIKQKLPDNNEAQEELQFRREQLQKWVTHKNNLLIPHSLYVWSESEVEIYRNSLNNDNINFRLNDFYNFVSTQAKFLERFSSFPGFVIQQAYNYAPNGPVHQAAKAAVFDLQKPLLLRDWSLSDKFNEANPCIKVIETNDDVQITSLDVDWVRNTFVAGRRDSSIILFDLVNGSVLRNLKEHKSAITNISFSFDGTIVSSGSKGAFYLWDSQSGTLLRKFNTNRARINSIASITNNKWVMGGDDGYLYWCDSESIADEPYLKIQTHGEPIKAIAISDSASIILAGGADGTIKVLSLQGESIKSLNTEELSCLSSVYSICLSYDGNRCLVGHQNGDISYWDIPKNKIISVLKGHDGKIYGISMTPDGRTAASCASDKTVRVWQLDEGICARVLVGHSFQVNAVRISPWGDEVVSSSTDGRVFHWSIEKKSCIDQHIGEEVTSFKELKDGRVVSGHVSGAILFYQSNTLNVQKRSIVHTQRVWGLDSFDEDKYLVSASWDGDLKILKTDTIEEIYSENFEKLFVASVNPKTSTLFVSGANRKISYFHLNQLDLQNSKDLLDRMEGRSTISTPHSGSIRVILSSKDCRYIYSASEGDYVIKIWDAHKQALVYELKGHESAVYAMSLSSDGLKLASAGKDKSIRIWNLETLTLERILHGHDRGINGVWFTSNDKFLCTTSWDGTFRMWNIRTGINNMIYAHAGLSQVVILKNKKQVILGTATGDVFKLSPHHFTEGF